MQTVKQFSVSAVNKPGRLAAVLESLRKEKVELLGVAVTDARHSLRFVAGDASAAASALQGLNLNYETHDVLLIDLPKQLNAYAHLCERLAAGHLEMDYTYAASTSKGTPAAVVKVNDLTKAQRVLSDGNGNGAGRKKLPRRRPVHSRSQGPAKL